MHQPVVVTLPERDRDLHPAFELRLVQIAGGLSPFRVVVLAVRRVAVRERPDAHGFEVLPRGAVGTDPIPAVALRVWHPEALDLFDVIELLVGLREQPLVEAPRPT